MAKKPLIQKALKAKIENLQRKRNTVNKKRSVRQHLKAPRNKAEERSRLDFKDWVEAHDAELDRHDTELRAWVYEDALESDKPVPYTMTYKRQINLGD